MLEDQQVILEL